MSNDNDSFSPLLMRYVDSAVLLVVALTATAARGQDTHALVRYVDSVATAAVAEHRTAGVSVAVVKNGRTVLAKGYGFADLPAVPVDAAALARVAGAYAVGNARLKVFVENGRLRMQQGAAPAFGLKYVGSNRFVRDDNDDVQYEFAAGNPAPSVVRRQGGNTGNRDACAMNPVTDAALGARADVTVGVI